jgi:hypothetical protein
MRKLHDTKRALTVREMMLGRSASFVERGEHELKGIDGNWRLSSVSAS